MTSVLAIILVALAGLLAPTGPARAQSEAASFLDPFPEGDRYRVQVWGDQMADGLLEGLAEQMANEPRFAIERKLRWLTGLLKVDADQEARTIEAALEKGGPHIVVVMLGAGDRLALRRPPNNRRVGVGSDEWKVEYNRRLDLVMRALRKRNVAVFWVGLPIMRREDVSEDAEMMNELFRGRALANGVRFIDIYASFADTDKSYSAHGPDLDGKTRLLRDGDGVHFTAAGSRRLAHFVERELKRAAAQAWDERAVPLAGSEAEQARIRPQGVRLAPLAPTGRPADAAAGPGGLRAAATPAAADTGDGIKAETSRITLRSIGEQGREESFTVEIVRPAIPAALVSLLTRRESQDRPSQMGDPVMTEILGGLTVVSSVTPLAEGSGERRRGPGSSGTPFYRVLLMGETLPPKPGRADEMPWPRPEPVLDARLALPPPGSPPAAPAPEPVSAPAATPASASARGDIPPLPRRPSRAFEAGRR